MSNAPQPDDTMKLSRAQLERLSEVVHEVQPEQIDLGKSRLPKGPKAGLGKLDEIAVRLLLGEHFQSLDAKSRLLIPSELRPNFPHEGAFVTLSPYGGLWIFPVPEFKRIFHELFSARKLDAEARQLKEYLTTQSYLLGLDGAFRLTLPERCVYQIKRITDAAPFRVVLSGMGNFVEVRSLTDWEAHLASTPSKRGQS